MKREGAIVVLATLLFACVELFYPFGRDQGNYAYPAWAWLEGQMPYRDVYVFKPPGTVWVHALAQLLFGHSVLSVRILDLGWTAATALAIWAALRRWGAPGPAPVLAGVLYSFFYADFDFWNTCQTDGWLNLPCALAILLVSRLWGGDSGPRVLPAAGALLGLGMCLKYTAAAFGLPIFGLLLARAWPERRFGRFAVELALVGLGAAGVLGLTGLWLWATDALPGFLDSQAVLVPAYVAKTGKTSGLLDKFEMLGDRYTRLTQLHLPLAALALGVLGLVAGGYRRPASIFALLWYLAGLASTMSQNKYFRYHFLSTLPGTAALGALALGALLAAVAARSRPGAWVLGAAVAVAAIWPSNYTARWEIGAKILSGRMTLRDYWERSTFKLDGHPMMDPYDCALRVEALSQPGDKVFVWGFDPLINFLARRLTVSRFLYNYPFAVSWGDPGYEAELMAALEADPPALFLVASGDANTAVTGNPKDSRALFDDFEALSAFVAARYEPVETVNRYEIYRRR